MGNAAGDYISGLCDISKVPQNPGDQQGQSKFDQRDANTGQEGDSFERKSTSEGRGFESGQISVKVYSYSYLAVEFAPEIKFEL